eukprot:COSAG04_NODE_3128_length_3138_cov_1.575189_1_plen_47_part_10
MRNCESTPFSIADSAHQQLLQQPLVVLHVRQVHRTGRRGPGNLPRLL